jgi:hypothetical protein
MSKVSILKNQLKPLEGIAVFSLKRTNSLNDGKFFRILHKVKPKEIVFFDGKQVCNLPLDENTLELFNGGFKSENCTYTIMNADLVWET